MTKNLYALEFGKKSKNPLKNDDFLNGLIQFLKVLHLVTLKGEIDFEFAKNEKKKGKFCLHPLNFLSTLKP
jgi:hypothetical protein